MKICGLASVLLMIYLSPTAKGMQISKPVDRIWPLGTGFNKRDSTVRPPCVTGKEIVYGGSSDGRLTMGVHLSGRDTLTSILANVGGSLDFFVFGGSASSSTYFLTEDTEEALVGGFEYGANGKQAEFKDLQLTPYGEAAVSLNDPLAFRDLCGDSYLRLAYLGGRLYLQYRFDFDRLHTKTEAISRVETRVLWWTETRTRREVLENLKENTHTSFSLFQIGGQPEKWKTMAPIASTWCAVKTFGSCMAPLEKMLDYVTAPESGFVNQLDNLKYDMARPERSSILGFDLGAYEQTHLIPGSWKFDQIFYRANPQTAALQSFLRSLLELQYRAYILLHGAQLAAEHETQIVNFDWKLAQVILDLRGEIEQLNQDMNRRPEAKILEAAQTLISNKAILKLTANETLSEALR
jgi:hypothetical protein